MLLQSVSGHMPCITGWLQGNCDLSLRKYSFPSWVSGMNSEVPGLMGAANGGLKVKIRLVR